MADSTSAAPPAAPTRGPIRYARYAGESDIPKIMSLVDTELSEPYNWYTYRYFLQDWYALLPPFSALPPARTAPGMLTFSGTGCRRPHLCFMAYDGEVPIGTIVCKQEQHRDKLERGYLAMLSTKEEYRGRGVGKLARSHDAPL
jgi:peptide alpha-N-acetyltransferase